MWKKSAFLASAVSAALVLVGGAAQAQTPVNSTNDFTLSFSNFDTFANANTLYGLSYAYGGTPGSSSFDLYFFSNYSNVSFNGPAFTSSSPSSAPYSNPTTVYFDTNNGGYWGATYNTTSPITLGTQGGLDTLDFNGTTGVSYNGIDYYETLFVPGTWSPGTGTGDYSVVSCTYGCSVGYSGGDTVFTESTTSYSAGTGVQLDVALYGGPAATPLPATWTMMLIGLAGLGFVGYRQSKKATLPVAA